MATNSKERSRQRLREKVIGVTLIVLITGVAVWYVLSKAGEWGVPGFSYANEHGSTCENGVFQETCTNLTPADVAAHLEVPLPADARVVSGTRVSGRTTSLVAELVIPVAQAPEVQAALTEKYGACRTDIPVPGLAEGMIEPCVMASNQLASDSMSVRHTMAMGLREGNTNPSLAVDVLWR